MCISIYVAYIRISHIITDIQNIKTTIHLNSIKLTETELNRKNNARARRLRKKGRRLEERQDYDAAIHTYTKGLALAGLEKKEKCFLYSNRSQATILRLKTGDLPKDEIQANTNSALEDAQTIISTDAIWWVGYRLLGQLHQCQRDFKEAIEWFERALVLNPNAAEVKLLRDVCRLEESKEKCKDYCNPLDSPSSLNEQAYEFRRRRGFGMSGDSLKRSIQERVRSPNAAVRQSALLLQAKLFQGGIDEPLNHEAAFSIFQELADHGEPAAFAELGFCYLFGDGVEQDLVKGVHWIEMSANAEESFGLHALAHLYERGIMKEENKVKALELYLSASVKGHGGASHNAGIFYLDGIGCSKDEERATQYFKLGALRGIPFSMDHLAWQYLNAGNVDLAVTWYGCAIECESVPTLLENSRFMEAVKEKRYRIRLERFFAEYSSFVKRNKAINQIMAIFAATREDSLVGTRIPIDREDFSKRTIWEHRLEIRTRANEGCLFAQELLAAMNFFQSACDNVVANQEYALALFADCLRTNHTVFDFNPGVERMVEFLCSNRLNRSLHSTGVDLNTRVCRVGLLLMRNDFENLFPLVEDCITQHPGEKFFRDVLAHVLGKLGRIEESLEEFDNALHRFPDDRDFLSGKMQAVAQLVGRNATVAEAVDVCKLFIEKAYPGCNMIPEAYFTLALLEINRNKMDEARDAYIDGLNAARNLIPYFLPYKSENKLIVGKLLATYEDSVREADSSRKEASVRKSRATGPIRFEVTMEHRKGFKELYDQMGEICRGGFFDSISFQPMHNQEQLDVTDLKEITLEEMFPFGDKIHYGRVLHVQLIEWSWDAYNNSYSVVKDKNHDCIHIAFQGFPDSFMKLFIGMNLTIPHPYYRLAIEGEKRAIRVDDPTSVTFGEVVPFCHYCWEDDVEVWCDCTAGYCSEECQRKHLLLLKHHWICEASDEYSGWESEDAEE